MRDVGRAAVSRAIVIVALFIIAAGSLWMRATREQRAHTATNVGPMVASVCEPEEPAIIGRSATARVAVENPSATSALAIERIEMSCTCVRVVSQPETIAAGGRAEIVVAFVPDAFSKDGSTRLTVHGRGETALRASTILHDGAASPFEGWPERALATRRGDEVCVVLSPLYVDGAVTGVRAFERGSAKELPSRVRGGEIAIRSGNMDVELLVTFGSGEHMTWSGPVEVEAGSVRGGVSSAGESVARDKGGLS